MQRFIPLSLYIHLPWCIKKCPYCDFNSHELNGDMDDNRYVSALLIDLEQSLPLVAGRGLISIFFGGGTPSLFSPQAIERLLEGIRQRIGFQDNIEITLEANPGASDITHFQGYKNCGVTRLSIGIQSFNDQHLKQLGRIHDGDTARRAIELAQKFFDNINLDLMYGLPQQTLKECQKDAETAVAWGTPHLSFYQLTLEPNTPFYRSPPLIPSQDIAYKMQNSIEKKLKAHGFEHYEVSAFAQAQKQCRHNLNYWQFGDYLAIGAGAHSKISTAQGVLRQIRHKHPKQYLTETFAHRPIAETHYVEVEDLCFEFMMNVLRLNTNGFSAELFAERTNIAWTSIQAKLDLARKKGLIKKHKDRWHKTRLGKIFLNDLLLLFLP